AASFGDTKQHRPGDRGMRWGFAISGLALALGVGPSVFAQDQPPVWRASPSPLPAPIPAPPGEKVLPINLATALERAGAKPLDVQIAGRQVEIAARAFDRAKLLWVPNLLIGTDYFAHTGVQQNFAGESINQNHSSFMAAIGPTLAFSASDAIYAPL